MNKMKKINKQVVVNNYYYEKTNSKLLEAQKLTN